RTRALRRLLARRRPGTTRTRAWHTAPGSGLRAPGLAKRTARCPIEALPPARLRPPRRGPAATSSGAHRAGPGFPHADPYGGDPPLPGPTDLEAELRNPPANPSERSEPKPEAQLRPPKPEPPSRPLPPIPKSVHRLQQPPRRRSKRHIQMVPIRLDRPDPHQ